MNILFTGGGTLGSVTPLLALHERLREEQGAHAFFWIATRGGVERSLIASADISVAEIYTGKLRRYFSFRNFVDPFLLSLGIVQSLYYLMWFKPDIIVSAGGYVAVPVLWAGWLLRRKSMLLQLDMEPGLANLITAFTAETVGVAFEEEARYFSKKKVAVVGIPVRRAMIAAANMTDQRRMALRTQLHLDKDLPVVLAIGGGTGASALNALIVEAAPHLATPCQIIHVTGPGKDTTPSFPRYHTFPFLKEELIDYLNVADIVVTRAGMGMLAELSVLGKPMIIIPIPHSHQERNAQLFERHKAGIYLSQPHLDGVKLAAHIENLMTHAERRSALAHAAKGMVSGMGEENVLELLHKATRS